MHFIILSLALSLYGSLAQGQPLQAEDVLASNLGQVTGLVKTDSSSCDLDINNTTVSGKILVSPVIYAYVGFYLFPDDLWELNESNHTLIHYNNSQKTDSVVFALDPVSHKILSYTFIHQSVTGNVCILEN